ncbi:MAG: HAMP domain-containing protein [Acidobacteria bacterium]|nr:HAMP domain-containing protein [Acidobacteriota bacterium]
MRIGVKIGGAFLLVLMLGIVGIAAIAISSQRMVRANAEVNDTISLLRNLEKVGSSLKDVEVGQRGFLLTGRMEYLDIYETGLRAYPHYLDLASASVKGDPAATVRFERIKALAQRRIRQLENAIEVRQREGLSAVLPLIQSGHGKQIMDDIRAALDEIESDELKRLEARRQNALNNALIVNRVLMIGLPLLIVSLVVLGVLFARNMSRTLDALARTADRISRGELAESPVSANRRDELGELQQSFRRMTSWLRNISEKARQLAAGDYTATIAPVSDRDELGFALAAMLHRLRGYSQDLRKRTEELEQLLETLPVYVWISADPARRIITGNRAANELLGVANGTNVSYLVNPEPGVEPPVQRFKPDGSEYASHELPMLKAMLTAEPVRDVEIELRFPDGRHVYVIGGAAPLIDDHGSVRGAVSAFVDITQLMETEKERQRMESELIRSRRNLMLAEHHERQNLARILHDGLQQILVAAKFRVSLTARNPAHEGLSEVDKLIDEAIAISRSLTYEISPPILHQARGDLVTSIKWLAGWMHDKHGLDVEISVSGEIPPVQETELLLFFSAARELLFNVVKHAGVRSAHLSLERLNGSLSMTVADTGSGFAPASSNRGEGDQSGIGLFGIAERFSYLSGDIHIDSAPGRGTRIRLTAPLLQGT